MNLLVQQCQCVCYQPYLIGIALSRCCNVRPDPYVCGGFLALLGAMSLAGMMIKNAIVLLDQVNIELDAGKQAYDAVLDASVARLRPVVLAAATTVLGVVPLLQDVFWIGMAITIMFGLTFGTILTMVVVPLLYATLNRLYSPEQAVRTTS